jgi:hypothetical protein
MTTTNTTAAPRRRRGPSAQTRHIIALRNGGAKQLVIAHRLGVSLGCVKQALRRARRRIAGQPYPDDRSASPIAALQLQVGPCELMEM